MDDIVKKYAVVKVDPIAVKADPTAYREDPTAIRNDSRATLFSHLQNGKKSAETQVI